MLKKKKTYAVITVFLFICVFIFTVRAQNTNVSSQTTKLTDRTNAYYYSDPTINNKKPNFIFTIMKSLFWLSLFAVGLYYLFRYLMKKQNKGNINNDIIKLIAQNSVAMGKYISIVKILNTYYIIGISDNGLTLIKEITEKTDSDALSVLESQLVSNVTSGVSFEETLQKFIGQIKTKKSSRDQNLKFMKKQQDRLNKLKRKSFDE